MKLSILLLTVLFAASCGTIKPPEKVTVTMADGRECSTYLDANAIPKKIVCEGVQVYPIIN